MDFGTPSPVHLQAHGPVIRTAISVTQEHANALQASGASIPEQVICNLLIDTGASNSLIKHEIAERAGLKLINSDAPVHGVGVDTTGRTYLGSILFGVESKRVPGVRHNIWVSAQIFSGSLQNAPNLDGLIGRDVLQFFEFFYDGPTGKFSLRYIKPH